MDRIKRQTTTSATEAIITNGSVDAGLRNQVVVFLPSVSQPGSGYSRLHTTLSRHLSALGVTSVRIRQTSVKQWNTDELSYLLDWISAETAATEFVFYGAGKTAFDCLSIAVDDSRIKGLFLIDSIGFRTKAFNLNHYFLFGPRRLLSKSNWSRWLRNVFTSKQSEQPPVNEYYPVEAPKAGAQEQRFLLWSLSHHKKLAHFVFTGSAGSFYNYKMQFEDMCDGFTEDSTLSHSHMPFSDHHFILASQREILVKELVNWIDHNFTVEAPLTDRKAA